MKKILSAVGFATGVSLFALSAAAQGVTITVSCGSVGEDQIQCRKGADAWEAMTGNTVEIVNMPQSATDHLALIQQMMASQASDIDVFTLDVIWPGIVAEHMVDMSEHVDQQTRDMYFQPIIEGHTVDGRLVALPWFTDAGILYYRTDLLEKYGKQPPTTWAELTATAKEIQDAERAAGNAQMQGFVWQGKAYEGLTCDALEWVDSFGGGSIVAADGTITINNPQAVEALQTAASWIGTISPQGVLNYQEEEARGVFQSGNAVFMRNWPYAYNLGNAEDSPIRGKFAVAALPKGGENGKHTGTLGGWSLGVSKYSENPEVAADFVKYMTSMEEQKRRATEGSYTPTIPALFDDPAVQENIPFVVALKDTFTNAVARPSGPTGDRYNQVSSEFYNAVHATLSGNGTAEENLARLEQNLKRLARGDSF